MSKAYCSILKEYQEDGHKEPLTTRNSEKKRKWRR